MWSCDHQLLSQMLRALEAVVCDKNVPRSILTLLYSTSCRFEDLRFVSRDKIWSLERRGDAKLDTQALAVSL